METITPASEESRRRSAGAPIRSPIFYGPNGLRAGWSILMYLSVLIALLFVSRFEVYWFALHLHQKLTGEIHPSITIVAEATSLLIVVLVTAGMARIEHTRAAFYGLMGKDRLRQFLIGIVSGFLLLSLLVGILTATGHLSLDLTHAPAGQSLGYATAWALVFFLVGMTEEFMLRGYLLFTLARGIRFWPAAFILAALFGLMHKNNAGESPFGLVSAALIALVFSLSLWRLGHLWWAIGFHMAWDWAESFFYGTPDSGMISHGRLMHARPAGNLLLSGGATGPEGSAWVVLVIALAALLVWFTQPRYGVQLQRGDALDGNGAVRIATQM